MQKIACLVVLYKTKCNESETVSSLLSQLNSEDVLYVWDNSCEYSAGNREYLNANNVQYKYIESPDSTPLAQVYSKVFYVADEDGFQQLILLDQDSSLPVIFLESYRNSIAKNDANVFIPKVIASGEVVSPAYSWKWIGWRIKDFNSVRLRSVSAINSGLCVPIKLMIKPGFQFPDRLKSYGTDVYMFEFFRSSNLFTIEILDCEVLHDLTFHKKNYSDSYLKPYREHMQAMKVIFCNENWIGSRLLFCLYVLMHRVKTTCLRRDLRFLKW